MQSRKAFMMMCVLLAKSCRGHRLPLNATIIAPTNVTRLKTWVDMRWKLYGAIHASAAQQKKHIKPSAIRQLSTTIAYDADHFLSVKCCFGCFLLHTYDHLQLLPLGPLRFRVNHFWMEFHDPSGCKTWCLLSTWTCFEKWKKPLDSVNSGHGAWVVVDPWVKLFNSAPHRYPIKLITHGRLCSFLQH